MKERLVDIVILISLFVFMVYEFAVNPDCLSYLEYVESASLDEIRAPMVMWGFGAVFCFVFGEFLGSFIPFSKKKQDP